jgi:hypothetical protein
MCSSCGGSVRDDTAVTATEVQQQAERVFRDAVET